MTCVSETSPLTANAVIAAIGYGQEKVRKYNFSQETSTQRLVECFLASYINFYMSVRNNPNNRNDKVEHNERCLHIRLMISSATTLITIAKILANRTDQDAIAACFKSEQRRMCAKTGNLCCDMLADIKRKHLPTPLEFRASIQAHKLPEIIHRRLSQAKEITNRKRRIDPASSILKSIPVGTSMIALQYLIDVSLNVSEDVITQTLRSLVDAPSVLPTQVHVPGLLPTAPLARSTFQANRASSKHLVPRIAA